ncbi:hypothetical protein [Bradyrhizobium sp.]|uniref:hypothetical protein n=1 Tax=Bradyrhizobium sp. TaxID=376 RepID=UPI002C16EFB9|nr:hypothetical protein [Bradyrhizobium sp.]HMM92464.1 hypothetical protein [Bradyrhizobium sp.]
MTTPSHQATEAQRESFLEAAQKEMIAFERKEREFRKQAKQEEALQLRLPLLS